VIKLKEHNIHLNFWESIPPRSLICVREHVYASPDVPFLQTPNRIFCI